MSSHFSRLRSLCLTSVLSFTLPLLVLGVGVLTSISISYIPNCTALGQAGVRWLLAFLDVFGAGHPFQGLIWLGFAFSFVAVLFDAFATHYTVHGHE